MGIFTVFVKVVSFRFFDCVSRSFDRVSSGSSLALTCPLCMYAVIALGILFILSPLLECSLLLSFLLGLLFASVRLDIWSIQQQCCRRLVQGHYPRGPCTTVPSLPYSYDMRSMRSYLPWVCLFVEGLPYILPAFFSYPQLVTL